MWPFKRTPTPQPATNPKHHFLSALWPFKTRGAAERTNALVPYLKTLTDGLPRTAVGMDNTSLSDGSKASAAGLNTLPDALIGWFLGQGFIGYQTCALIAQNWLIEKAVALPARDALRHGWNISIPGQEDEDSDEIRRVQAFDKSMDVYENLRQFVHMGRLFGIRVLIFRVESSDPRYYEKPFNPDGVTPNSYLGMSQVDPYWLIPELDNEAIQNPASPHFYEPTWWVVNGVRYHRTHLRIFRAFEVPDILKPTYRYGGMSIPQRIVERVYAAERTANEGPQLAMTKRLQVWKTDLAQLYANQEKAAEHMSIFTSFRDNYGVKLVDTEDTIEQHDTGLADLDVTIMTQYQLVAAAAGVPATKLLGTTPKGFSATGEYDESSYHEELETIQSHDLSRVLERHYLLLALSKFPKGTEIAFDWNPVDSPTAKEYAEISKIAAEADYVLVQAGAIDGMDVRNRLQTTPNSGYTGIADVAQGEEHEPEDPTAANPKKEDLGATARGRGV